MDTLPIVQPVYNIPASIQKITVGASSIASTAINSYRALLISTVDCYVTFDGTAATSNSFYLPAKTPVCFNVDVATIINVVQSTTSGNLYITGLN